MEVFIRNMGVGFRWEVLMECYFGVIGIEVIVEVKEMEEFSGEGEWE